MRSLLATLALFVLCPAFAATFDFELDYPEEKFEIERRMPEIEAGAKRLQEYWGFKPERAVKVRIKKFESNPNFLNCARIEGDGSIYIHSLKSLRDRESAPGMNPYCATRSYTDLADTILHEYSHVLDMRSAPAGTKPLKWVWEGLAGHLSGQLDREEFASGVSRRVKKEILPIDVCTREFKADEAYTLGGALIRYFERKSPGIGKQLRLAEKPMALASVLKPRGLSCLLTSSEIIQTLSER